MEGDGEVWCTICCTFESCTMGGDIALGGVTEISSTRRAFDPISRVERGVFAIS